MVVGLAVGEGGGVDVGLALGAVGEGVGATYGSQSIDSPPEGLSVTWQSWAPPTTADRAAPAGAEAPTSRASAATA